MIDKSFLLLLRRMSPMLSFVTRAASAMLMIGALLFLTTANFWVYGAKKEKQHVATTSQPDEEDASNGAPNPVEEKNANSLQNLSEYLHQHQHTLLHPVSAMAFGNRHDIINFPIHHLELLTPPPKFS